MALFYKRLSDEDPRSPAYVRFRVPDGADNYSAQAQRKGWVAAMPAECAVYDEQGNLVQESPKPPEPEPDPEVEDQQPEADKPKQKKEGK